MQLHQAKIRLSSSLLNEVVKEDLTVPEIVVLRQIHGLINPETGNVESDAVVEIKPTRFDSSRTEREERDRLAMLYNGGLQRQGLTIAKMFPVGLPQTADGIGGVVKDPGPIVREKRKYERKADVKVDDEASILADME